MQNEILWTAAFLDERFTTIVSPLGWSCVGSLFEQAALRDPLRFMGYPQADTIPATRLWRGYPYVNVEIFQIFYKPFPAALVPADAVRYFPDGDLSWRLRAPYPPSRYAPRFLLSLLWHLLRHPLNSSPLNYWVWKRFARRHNTRLERLRRQLSAAREPQTVLAVLDGLYALDCDFLRIHRWSLTYADLLYKVLALWTGPRAQTLIRDVPSLTRTLNAELQALARCDPPLSRELLERRQSAEPPTPAQARTLAQLDAFLARHGHRSFSLDIGQPTFAEDPTQLLGLVSRTAADLPAADLTRPRADDWRGLTVGQRALLRPLVALARRYAALREDQRYYWQSSLAVTRRAYLALGQALATRGVLADPSDIFYATRQDIDAFFSRAQSDAPPTNRIRARQREWASYAAQSAGAPPAFLRGDQPFSAEPIPPPKTNEWQGRGASPGTARGAARVVLDPRELGRVGSGEILVAPSTDPGWTPVFARLAGLVLERGGVLSHGAVVAREYHLPAVTAVKQSTQLIHDGDWLELDGTTGVVRRLEGGGKE